MTVSGTSAPRSYSPSAENLRTLLIIRSIALAGQSAVLVYVVYSTGETAQSGGVIVSLAALAILTALSLWRTARSWPVVDSEFFGQLLIDVIGWTSLMYFTGGANNPFISYYIVPLVISAAVLPWAYTWWIAGACILAYSVLLYVYVPFPLFTPHAGMHHGDGSNVHILGMWFNFLFSAGLITYFVVRMAAVLRRQEAQTVQRREDQLRNDQIMAVASLAAGTAHELGTPLSTMTVLLEEMLAENRLDDQARKDCLLLREKVVQCRSTLAALSRTAEFGSIEETLRRPADDFTRETLEQWAVRRPGVRYSFDCPTPSPDIELDLTLTQALENLLNNAADTGSDKIAVALSWTDREVKIDVRDWGPGLPPQVMEQFGKPVVHRSTTGLGIGLMLSQATVERLGGKITLHNLKDGGAVASLTLPVADAGGS